jgi:hypothetical protein
MSDLTQDEIVARLTILHDAYLTTFRKDFYLSKGEYLRVDQDEDLPGNPTTCHACALGTMFLGKVLGASGEVTLELNYGSSRRLVGELEQVFDKQTLAYAEALFEGYAHVTGPLENFWSSRSSWDDGALVGVLSRQPMISATHRGRKILLHLIENEGRFNLAEFPSGEAAGEYDVLSENALAVLKRYGIRTKET